MSTWYRNRWRLCHVCAIPVPTDANACAGCRPVFIALYVWIGGSKFWGTYNPDKHPVEPLVDRLCAVARGAA